MEKGKVTPYLGEWIYEIVFVLMVLFCEEKMFSLRENVIVQEQIWVILLQVYFLNFS